MRVPLFANPPWWELDARGCLRNGVRAGSRWPYTRPASFLPGHFRVGSYLPYPFFLGSAAAWAMRAFPNDAIVFRDSIARGETDGDFCDFIEQLHPTEVVIETGAASWPRDRRWLAWIKERLPATRVAVAGPPARELGAQAMAAADTLVDAWLVGEYEKNAVRFIEGQSGVIEFDALNRTEFASMPFPVFEGDSSLNYFDANPRGQQWPQMQLLTSRGCPYKCNFCAWTGNMSSDDPDGTRVRTVRFHSAEWIDAFVRDFIGRHPSVKCLYLDDDTFNLQDKHVLEISEVLGRIGLPWFAMCRADTSKPETWRAMREAGCRGVKVGFESGVQRVIDDVIHKDLDLEVAAETARWLRSELGFTVHGTFTIGLPGETADERNATRQFIRHLKATGAIDTAQLSATAEIPSTPLAHAMKHGLVSDPNYVSSPDGLKKLEVLG